MATVPHPSPSPPEPIDAEACADDVKYTPYDSPPLLPVENVSSALKPAGVVSEAFARYEARTISPSLALGEVRSAVAVPSALAPVFCWTTGLPVSLPESSTTSTTVGFALLPPAKLTVIAPDDPVAVAVHAKR